MKKILLVYNPRSAHFWRVEQELLPQLRELKGVMLGKYEVKATDVDDNARKLARVIGDGDLLLAAGGDGTANIALNGLLRSDAKGVRFAVIGYGNFNDMARAFGNLTLDEILKTRATETWPLDCKVNGKHWRYAMCYVTAGMFAESCAVFDVPKTRAGLQKKKHQSWLKSLFLLVRWWFKNRKRRFLPDFALVGTDLPSGTAEGVKCVGCSDYMAINGPFVAKKLKGGPYFLQKGEFLSVTGCMTKFFRLVPTMLRALLKKFKGVDSDYDCLAFPAPAEVMLQAEGEYRKFSQVTRIEVAKTTVPVLAIRRRE